MSATNNPNAGNNTSIAKLDPVEVITAIESLSERFGPKAMVSLSTVAKSIKLAEGIKLTRSIIRQSLPLIRDLAGCKLGFRTDKDKPGGGTAYDDAIIVDCITEATLRGVSWAGNEFNIIAGGCYITKEGYSRLVCDIEGVTDYLPMPGIPNTKEGGATVPMKATWKRNGIADSYERIIPVRLNTGMGVDAAIGKALRKLHASVHYKLTASTQSAFDQDFDPTEADPNLESSTAADLAKRLKAGPQDGPRVTQAEDVTTKTNAPVATDTTAKTDKPAGDKPTPIPMNFVEIAITGFETAGGDIKKYFDSESIGMDDLENGDGKFRRKHIDALGKLTKELEAKSGATAADGNLFAGGETGDKNAAKK